MQVSKRPEKVACGESATQRMCQHVKVGTHRDVLVAGCRDSGFVLLRHRSDPCNDLNIFMRLRLRHNIAQLRYRTFTAASETATRTAAALRVMNRVAHINENFSGKFSDFRGNLHLFLVSQLEQQMPISKCHSIS